MSNLEGTNPWISDRYVMTGIAGEDLTVGQVVEITGDLTVKASTLTTTPSNKRLGVCVTSAKNGAKVTVLCRGFAHIIAYGTITAGDMVGSAPGGKVQTIAQPTSSDCNTSAGTATTIRKMMANMGLAWKGASSGGTASILLT
jgi:hypothetical protein